MTTSGLFMGLAFVFEKIKLEQQVDVALAVRCLRRVRPTFITTLVLFLVVTFMIFVKVRFLGSV